MIKMDSVDRIVFLKQICGLSGKASIVRVKKYGLCVVGMAFVFGLKYGSYIWEIGRYKVVVGLIVSSWKLWADEVVQMSKF